METAQQKEELKRTLERIIVEHNGFQGERLYIFGYSYITRVLCDTLYRNGVHVAAFLDNAQDKIGTYHGEIPILSPEALPADHNVYVLIHSAHAQSMIAQLKTIVSDIEPRILHLEYPKKDSDAFWKETQYAKSLQMLHEGYRIYEHIMEANTLLVVNPVVSIGDYSLMEMTLHQYLEEHGVARHKVIVCGKGAAKTVALFPGERTETLSWEEMCCFVKYVMFMGEESVNALMVFPFFHVARRLYHLYNAFSFTSTEMDPLLIYQLREPYATRYPDIFEPLSEEQESALALVEGKSLVLSPYANTMAALPAYFWDQLVEAAKEMGYRVYTNVTPSEEEIPGTYRLEVPLSQMGTCLEKAGAFVALRSGICDIAGRAKCKQIVVYSKSYKTLGNIFLGYDHNDLRALDVSPNAVQVVYGEKSVEEVLRKVACICE